MSQTIYKYPLTLTDFMYVPMPKGAKILSVQMQGNSPCVWAWVNPNEQREESKKIRCFGTGHPIVQDKGERLEFLGTIQLMGGQLVFHLFESIKS